MPQRQRRNDRGELVCPQRVGGRHYEPSHQARTDLDRLLRVVESRKQRARSRRKLLAGAGQVQLPGRAVHERRAELLLQRA